VEVDAAFDVGVVADDVTVTVNGDVALEEFLLFGLASILLINRKTRPVIALRGGRVSSALAIASGSCIRSAGATSL
jgi:hypothetical protein